MRIIILFLVIVFFSSCTAKTVETTSVENARYIDNFSGQLYTKYSGDDPNVTRYKLLKYRSKPKDSFNH